MDTLPCGKCLECKKRRISGWSYRLMKEEQRSTSALFVTLTYDTDHVPLTQKGYMTLRKQDVQLFLKRLRKKYEHTKGSRKITYYCAGEYGGRSSRPHYHIILFNASEEKIEKSWNLGSIHIGKVNHSSVGYTLKYISKPGRIPYHKNDDRKKEFSLMSKGIGSNYLTNVMIKWHHADQNNRMYTPIEEGKRIALPRYYSNKIYTKKQREDIAIFIADKKQTEMQPIFEKMSSKEKVEYIENNRKLCANKERINQKDTRNLII